MHNMSGTTPNALIHVRNPRKHCSYWVGIHDVHPGLLLWDVCLFWNLATLEVQSLHATQVCKFHAQQLICWRATCFGSCMCAWSLLWYWSCPTSWNGLMCIAKWWLLSAGIWFLLMECLRLSTYVRCLVQSDSRPTVSFFFTYITFLVVDCQIRQLFQRKFWTFW